MTICNWIGGANPVQQIDHLTPGGTIEADDKFTVTLTAEDGQSSSVTVAAGSSTLAEVVENIQQALEASASALFQAVQWTHDASKIIATARVPGVPFHCSVSTSEGDDSPADDQTFTCATAVANSGPNDFAAPANWDNLPGEGDQVRITNSPHAILYSLRHLAGVALEDVRIGPGMTGAIGDDVTGAFCVLEAGAVEIHTELPSARLELDTECVRITRTRRGALTQPDITLKGKLGVVRILGEKVLGRIAIAPGSELADSLIVADAPYVILDIGTGTTGLGVIEVNSGAINLQSSAGALNISGNARLLHHGSQLSTTTVRGGYLGLIDTTKIDDDGLIVFGGEVDLNDHRRPTLSISKIDLEGGVIDARGTATDIVAAAVNHQGGDLNMPNTIAVGV